MKKYTTSQLLSILAVPALTVLLGLILLFSPDTASALLGKLLGWAGVLVGAVLLFRAVALKPPLRSRFVLPVLCLVAGIWLLTDPLILARFLGRGLGLILLLRGIRSMTQTEGGKPRLSTVIPALLGLLLVLLPMTTTRLVFNLAGIVIIFVGITDGFDRLREKKQLEDGADPSIIDVEKV